MITAQEAKKESAKNWMERGLDFYLREIERQITAATEMGHTAIFIDMAVAREVGDHWQEVENRLRGTGGFSVEWHSANHYTGVLISW